MGAGAAAGLETLMTRMRAEEQLRQHQDQLTQQKTEQDRQYDLDRRAQDNRDLDSTTNRKLTEIKLDAINSFINPKTPEASTPRNQGVAAEGAMGPAAPMPGAVQSIAGAGAMGPEPDAGAQGMTRIGPAPGGAGGGSPEAVSPTHGTLRERALADLAGFSPTGLYGSVPQDPKPKGPEDFNAEETFYNGLATKNGYKDYKMWGQADPEGLASARRKWAGEAHFTNPAQASEPVVAVDDPQNPGNSMYVPRSQAAGMRSTLPAGQRERLAAYDVSIDTAKEILELGQKLNWKGIGPIAGRVGSAAMEYGGIGNPDEEHLRNLFGRLKASAAFQEGGKQFTGTEKKMLDDFLASANQNPAAAAVRLQSFIDQAERSRGSLNGSGGNYGSGGHQPGPGRATAPAGGGQSPAPGQGTNGEDDIYSQYLRHANQPPK